MCLHKAWWLMPVIPAPGRLKQVDKGLKLILGCVANLRTTWATRDPVSKNQNQIKPVKSYLWLLLRYCYSNISREACLHLGVFYLAPECYAVNLGAEICQKSLTALQLCFILVYPKILYCSKPPLHLSKGLQIGFPRLPQVTIGQEKVSGLHLNYCRCCSLKSRP